MGHFLQFGCGPHRLPEPWQNLDGSHDIRKRLRFDDDSVTAILAEHVIEHVPFLQGFSFFRECLRVLKPAGVLRIVFPDVGRFVSTYVDLRERLQAGCIEFSPDALRYADRLAERPDMALPKGPPMARTRAAMTRMLTSWGHQMAWSRDSAAGSLLAAGFSRVRWCDYGEGDLAGIDGHHNDVGPELAKLESTILEAKK